MSRRRAAAPLTTAVWQEPGLGVCLLCPIQSSLSKVSTDTGSGEHHLISLNLNYMCMPRHLLSWQRKGGSGIEQGTQCLSTWLHDRWSRVLTFPLRGTKTRQRRYNGVGVGVWKWSGGFWNEGAYSGVRQTWFHTDSLVRRPLCSEIIKVSSITPEIRTTWPDLCSYQENFKYRVKSMKHRLKAQ